MGICGCSRDQNGSASPQIIQEKSTLYKLAIGILLECSIDIFSTCAFLSFNLSNILNKSLKTHPTAIKILIFVFPKIATAGAFFIYFGCEAKKELKNYGIRDLKDVEEIDPTEISKNTAPAAIPAIDDEVNEEGEGENAFEILADRPYDVIKTDPQQPIESQNQDKFILPTNEEKTTLYEVIAIGHACKNVDYETFKGQIQRGLSLQLTSLQRLYIIATNEEIKRKILEILQTKGGLFGGLTSLAKRRNPFLIISKDTTLYGLHKFFTSKTLKTAGKFSFITNLLQENIINENNMYKGILSQLAQEILNPEFESQLNDFVRQINLVLPEPSKITDKTKEEMFTAFKNALEQFKRYVPERYDISSNNPKKISNAKNIKNTQPLIDALINAIEKLPTIPELPFLE